MRWLVTACLLVVIAQRASAEPTILVVETRGAPQLPALVSQLEMHVGEGVTVRRHAAPDRDPLTFAGDASAFVSAGTATVVVWIAPVEHGYLVFAAGGLPGRGLLELVQIDLDAGTAELERTIALKTAGLLDAILAPRATIRSVIAIEPVRRPVWRLEVFAAVAREPHERRLDGRTGLWLGRASERRAWYVAPLIGAHWQPSGVIEREIGTASVTELAGVAACDLGRRLGPVDVFARPRVTAAVLFARGSTDDGRRGEVSVVTPYVGLDVGARYPITEVLSLGVVGGPDVAPHRRKLVIDGQTIVDIGALRWHVGALATVSL